MSAAPHGSIPNTNRKPSTQTPVSPNARRKGKGGGPWKEMLQKDGINFHTIKTGGPQASVQVESATFWDQSCALKVVGSKWKDKCLSPSKYHGEGMAAIARTIWWRRPSAPQQQPRRPRSTKWNRATSRPHECCPPWVNTQHQQKTQHSDTGVHLPPT